MSNVSLRKAPRVQLRKCSGAAATPRVREGSPLELVVSCLPGGHWTSTLELRGAVDRAAVAYYGDRVHRLA